MIKYRRFFKNNYGFTLVELMITMMISVVIIGAIYSAYTVQQNTYTIQDSVGEMQQNIRAALMLMSRDIRMAGFRGNGDSQAGFQHAARDALVLTADLNEDGDTSDSGENIGYDLYMIGGDELTKIGRASSSNTLTWSDEGSGHYEISEHQPLAEYIEGLEFNYILADGSATTSPSSDQLNQIRSVQISILARAGSPDPNLKFVNTMLYCPASHPIKNLTTEPPQCEDSAGNTLATATWGPYNDRYRRRLLITTIQCRNMGL